ncbi:MULTISPECIES: shikimate kinase [unclassified Frondihabitans]|uniref:shikimate kinase n=1 Tax=unclassified Frondihabitans TaxID=2626248 RepID=UPI000F515507|nr:MULTISPECIES: shikimate kinase [unclassified Frondihabitans]RPE75111.1 shikimate kinase [Frondihabitans sp. PhB153]RPF04353.1 shikimate kinase [Frondihabitans sp. PhB161]
MSEERHRPVVLIGPMGAGKTSVGRRVAKRLGRAFVDTDKEIVKEHGPIPALFESLGEPGFRELERDAVTSALAGTVVVSLGGGAVLDEGTRVRLRDERVVLLTVTPEAVESRIRGSDRPLLHHGGIAAWKRIAAERAPIYASLADLTLDTSNRPLSHVVDDIVAWVETEPS